MTPADHAATIREHMADGVGYEPGHPARAALAALVTQAEQATKREREYHELWHGETDKLEAAEARADQLHAELVEVKEAATALVNARNQEFLASKELRARADQLERENDALREEYEGPNYILRSTHAAIVGQLQRERDEAQTDRGEYIEIAEREGARADQLQEAKDNWHTAYVRERRRAERAETALRQIADGTTPDRIGRYDLLRDWVHKTARAALADSGETT